MAALDWPPGYNPYELPCPATTPFRPVSAPMFTNITNQTHCALTVQAGANLLLGHCCITESKGRMQILGQDNYTACFLVCSGPVATSEESAERFATGLKTCLSTAAPRENKSAESVLQGFGCLALNDTARIKSAGERGRRAGSLFGLAVLGAMAVAVLG